MNAEATKSEPASGIQHQIYQTPLFQENAAAIDQLPWKANQPDPFQQVLTLGIGQGSLWAKVDGTTLQTVDGPNQATVGLRSVQREFSSKLALIALDEEVLVNGAPALRLAILGPKDSIYLVKAGVLLYVTERFRPFVGRPIEQSGLLGLECPACAIEIQTEPSTHVVTCRCGAVYHHETEESHPDLPPEERLNCFRKTKVCLRCKQQLTLEEKLVWDPATL
jgi:hypothetical protein